jgi:hypothetical protein
MKIVNSTHNRFEQLFKHVDQATGYVIGTDNIVLNFVKRKSNDDAMLSIEESDKNQVKQLLPINLSIIGFYFSCDLFGVSDVNQLTEQVLKSKLAKSLFNNNCIIIGDKNGGIKCFIHNGDTVQEESLSSESVKFHIMDTKSDDTDDSYVLLECSASIQISNISSSSANRDGIIDAYIRYFSSNELVFIHNSKLLTSGAVSSLLQDQLNLDITDDSLLAYQPLAPREEFITKKKQKSSGPFLIDELKQSNQYNSSSSVNSDLERNKLVKKTVRISAFVDHSRIFAEQDNLIQILGTDNYPCNIKISTICYAKSSASISDILASIRQRFVEQLKDVKKAVGQTKSLSLRVNQGPVSVYPHSIGYYHFLPDADYPHIITVCHTFYQDDSDEELTDYSIKYRQQLHDRFYFSTRIPFLRVGRALPFHNSKEQDLSSANRTANKLNNVHLFCRTSGLPININSKMRLVKGTYTYYHYMQDGFNDDLWGCAYRSLQTLISYCRYNQLSATSRSVPTIPQIQQCLVELGDKPSTFNGSKQWIGAFENSLVLDQWCNVQCKILNVNNRKELLDNHLRTLVRHFEENGTPVMIGGGVLAYTMLGIHYDETTSDVRFLILDPHYKGSDTVFQQQQSTNGPSGLEVMLRDGWVGWKKAEEVFIDNNFYNMCMPQIPNTC